MPPAGFEPAIPAGEQLQTYDLDRSATGIGTIRAYHLNFKQLSICGQHLTKAKIKRVRGSSGTAPRIQNLNS